MNKQLGLVWCLGLLTACGAAPAGGEAETEAGSALQLNLSTMGASGTEYRLGPATVAIYRGWETPFLNLEVSGNEQKLHVPVEPDSYRVKLEPGWTLSRVDGTTLTPVAATLTSPEWQDAYVQRYQATPVTFAFHLGEAGIDLGVSVTEGVPPGYDAQLVPMPGGGYEIEWAYGGHTCCFNTVAEALAYYPSLNIFVPTP